jgi:hypothetical protein
MGLIDRSVAFSLALALMASRLSHTPFSYEEPLRDTALCNLLVDAVSRSPDNLVGNG